MARGTFYTTEQLGPKQRLTPEGFLLCEDVPLARTGMMLYGPDETPIDAGPDGIVKIFREDADVFSDETIASAQGKPVCDDHPDDDVTPETWRELAQGIMLNVRRGTGALDDLLLGDLLVTTTEGIEAVRGGKCEVSLGYDADYTETAPGAGKQSNIIINHIALVEQGRCGPRCAIGDSKPAYTTKAKDMTTKVITKKRSSILDALMKAFKAKDAAEVEELAKKVADEEIEGTEGGDTHIHVNSKDDGGEELKAHIEQNAKEHAEMRDRLDELEKRLTEITEAKATGDDANTEVGKEGMLDEVPEELKEEAKKAKDSAYLADSFKDTASLAEILVPGIRIPTFDAASRPMASFKAICALRTQALDLAYTQPDTRGIIDELLGGKAFDAKKMTCDAAKSLFRSAAAMKRAANNSASKRGTSDQTQTTGTPAPVTLAEINRRNAARYSNN